MSDEGKTIQWHQGFRGGIQATLWEYRDFLQFDEEVVLNNGTLQMDMLVLKKDPDAVIDNDIARMFRVHNIIEYKSPEDAMTLDDYCKTLAYTLLYKTNGGAELPAEQLTATLFRHSNPKKLFRDLKNLGARVEEIYPGVYYVSGLVFFPTQIIVGRELEANAFAMLRAMTPNADAADARNLITASNSNSDPAFQNLTSAVLQVSVAANRNLYENIRRESAMCEALRDLMKDEIEKEMKAAAQDALLRGRKDGIKEGRKEGRRDGIMEERERIACDMIRAKVSPQIISTFTRFPLTELQALADSLGVPLNYAGGNLPF